ncbi:dihydrolipoamide acyltransferase [Microbacterium aurum]|uniref:Dihydrolipoamide acetyltransferase component of pyruvate dehydrogenase complex n=1 Tax=Microbacterium aurum TaxID=36805 RepID=A0A1P8U931_9MICO|nr:dihydrolipoamide acetyltransferase family protein [Microbacterium aurum]APZ34619.1 dihydrolipoamide acyltransferase [Microbacterium aurum]MBM7828510.1 pyruvate dehydrogenase E2 component (dihydrolipoamide acetyltransferase) [Microbacterium aurum]
MIAEFRLPDLGEGLPEAEIVQWLVARGDEVTLNQPIAEVETAKAIVELPSPFAGTVSDLHAAAGDVVAVGAPLIAIDVPGDVGALAGAGGAGSADPAGVTRETAADTAAAAADTDATVPNLVGYGAAPRTAGRPQRRARAVRAAAASASASDTAVLAHAPHDVVAPAPTEDLRHERPRSTPPVRAYAKERGVDLALVEASGVTGVIRREDVDRYADAMRAQAASASATAAPGTPGARETRIPIRGVRKHTAAAMVQSAFTAPHVTTFLEVDVTETVRLVADLRADRRLDGHRIGILAVAAKAVCLALRAEPSLNARWDGPAGEIVQFHYVNLGIAAATERGLVVPHIADADRLTLVELADAIGALAQTARSGRSAPGALSGGTFSITNFGVFGIDAGTPILNPGEAGILGLGSVRRRPWEHDGQIVLRDIVTLSLSFDHRLADGQEASRFLRAVGDILREPGRAMLLS